MHKLLHIVASPRGDQSRTLRVAAAFLERFREIHPDWLIDELDVFDDELPRLTGRQVDGKYVLLDGRELYGELRDTWDEILQHITRFKEARAYLVSTPMWNFSIPYALKQYIDLIVQPRHLFHYVDGRSEGLLTGRRMVVVSARGGDYRPTQACHYDHVEPYLRTLFGFVGIVDIRFVRVEPLDGVPAAAAAETVEQASHTARSVAEVFLAEG
ncbi:MAG: NAD(P)H-dependent oxidoreductase [Desulfuromonadales bacterium]|nr:NAD(P)H-dependent oxidoreductase [Desulfuromonadales bacterium]